MHGHSGSMPVNSRFRGTEEHILRALGAAGIPLDEGLDAEKAFWLPRVWGFGFKGSAFRVWVTQRPESSSFLGLPCRVLNINHKKELLRGLWV